MIRGNFAAGILVAAIFAAGVSASVGASTATAADWYVDNVLGDDRYSGAVTHPQLFPQGPVRTIGAALRRCGPYDRIILAANDQPYYESITLGSARHDGVVIEGNGAVLDGTAPIPAQAWTSHGRDLFSYRPHRLGRQLLFLDGIPLAKAPVLPPVDPLFPGFPPNVEPLSWYVWGPRVFFKIEPGRLPDQYPLHHARHDVGVTLYFVQDVEIVDLVVQGFRIDGVQAADNVRNAALGGLTVRGNGRSGIALRGSSQLTIAACLVGNNGEAQVLVQDLARARLINSDLVEEEGVPTLQVGPRATAVEEQTEAAGNGDQQQPADANADAF